MKYTEKTKEEMITAILEEFYKAWFELKENFDDQYYVGRYTMICDILAAIPIYEKGGDEE